MVRCLITGITGFSGSHLAEYCLNQGYEVFGLTRGRYHQYNFINHIKNQITLIGGDLSDFNSMRKLLENSEPDIIFHLGAMTSVPISWRAPKLTIDSNTLGTLNLLESIRKSKYNPKILNIGTSEEYGLVYPNEVPIKEENPLRPLSPYAVSKIASDLLGYQYHQSYGLKIIRVRPFNIVGTRGGREIVTAEFAYQLIEIENGIRNSYIRVGNLNSIRDFNDVRDIIRAYDLAIKKCDYGTVYNICSQSGITIRELLNKMISLSYVINKKKIRIEGEDKRMRPSDVENLIGDSTKFRKKTGWKPEISLEKSLQDVIEYWREHA